VYDKQMLLTETHATGGEWAGAAGTWLRDHQGRPEVLQVNSGTKTRRFELGYFAGTQVGSVITRVGESGPAEVTATYEKAMTSGESPEWTGGIGKLTRNTSATSYQLRLQTYYALKSEAPFTILTTRPVNLEFAAWLQRWGVKVEGAK
jgi:hypothetical protein